MYDQTRVHDAVANDPVSDERDERERKQRANPIVGCNPRDDREDEICGNSAAGADDET
jgi:hypothetical protein